MPAETKGQVFLSFEAVLRKARPEQWDSLVPRLPDELKVALQRRTIVSVGWYPAAWYNAMHDALEALAGPALATFIGREATLADIHLIFRWVLRLFSPELLLSQGSRIFGAYMRGCEILVEQPRPGVAVVRYRSVEGLARGVWAELAEGSLTFLEVAGAKSARVKVLAGGEAGARVLDLELSWAP
jgi:hypothetical protein